MSSYNLGHRQKKVNKGFKYIPIQTKNHLTGKNIAEKEFNEFKDENTELLSDLLDDLSSLKTKRSLEYFVAENREYINQLQSTQRNVLLTAIKNRFYPLTK